MRSRIYCGDVWHERLSPAMHAFAYPHFALSFDLQEMQQLPVNRWLLGVNRAALLSVHQSDYLRQGEEPLLGKVTTLLASYGVQAEGSEISLITLPRMLGYAFNPVNFYIVRNSEGDYQAFIAEVHNTFGEGHVYVLPASSPSLPLRFSFSKDFFVSPFFPVQGDYELRLEEFDDRLKIVIELKEADTVIFRAGLNGERRELNTAQLLRTLCQYPLCILSAMLRIYWQAGMLFFRRKVGLYDKPIPASPKTIRVCPGVFDCLRLVVVRILRKFNFCKSLS